MRKAFVLVIVAALAVAVLAFAAPAFANGERGVPPKDDQVTTTTAPPVVTTTTAPPVTTTTAPPVTTTTAPPVTTTTAPAVPVPAYTISLACPGTFTIALSNIGTASAVYNVTQYVSVTGRSASADGIRVRPGETVNFDQFIAYAGEEGSSVTFTVSETVTGYFAANTATVVNCVPDSPIILASAAEAVCVPDVLVRTVTQPGETVFVASAAEATATSGPAKPLTAALALAGTALTGVAVRRRRLDRNESLEGDSTTT